MLRDGQYRFWTRWYCQLFPCQDGRIVFYWESITWLVIRLLKLLWWSVTLKLYRTMFWGACGLFAVRILVNSSFSSCFSHVGQTLWRMRQSEISKYHQFIKWHVNNRDLLKYQTSHCMFTSNPSIEIQINIKKPSKVNRVFLITSSLCIWVNLLISGDLSSPPQWDPTGPGASSEPSLESTRPTRRPGPPRPPHPVKRRTLDLFTFLLYWYYY